MDSATTKWIRSEADGRAVRNGCRFDMKDAEHVCDFFERHLRHSKGEFAGRPFELIGWQRLDLLMPMFGWKKSNGKRRFDRVYVEVPKKNGKSTLAAGVGLYMLCADGEPGAEVYSAATEREQAAITHREAIAMVENSPALESKLTINQTTKTISHMESRSLYRALSSEARSKEGLNIHCLICDELHAWKNRTLWATLRYGSASRSEPLLFSITTAGDDMQSVCREQHEYAEGITNDTIQDDGFLGFIRAAEDGDDWTSPDTWKKANPSYGVTIREEELAIAVREAQQSPANTAAFKRYRLNVWSTAESPWLDFDAWQRCGQRYDESDLIGEDCWAGLDLAKTQDMSALVLVFPREDEKTWLLSYFWLPDDAARKNNKYVPFLRWADDGHMTITPGNVCDYSSIRAKFEELAGKFRILGLVYDPWNAEQFTQEIDQEIGIERLEFRQTIGNFAEPTAEFERAIYDGSLVHDRNPVLTWQAGNVQVTQDANGNKRPVKPKHIDVRKIDGIVAAIMGYAKAMSHDSGPVSVMRVL